MKQESLKVLSNQKIAESHYIIEFASVNISKKAQPGQFVQIMTDDSYEPLLPRPFSFLNAKPGRFRILYHVVGKGTKLLSEKKKGDSLKILGPLGRGFNLKPKKQTLVMVGGGVGIPPLYHLAEFLVKKKKISKKNILIFLGARKKEFLHCEKDFKKLKIRVITATDNGSKGHKGVITEPLKAHLQSLNGNTPQVYTCGPTPMLKAVSLLAQQFNTPCQISVEEPMPCGFGVCLGCAIKVKKDSNGFKYALSCTEGPVFSSGDILWA